MKTFQPHQWFVFLRKVTVTMLPVMLTGAAMAVDLHRAEMEYRAMRERDENGKIPPNARINAVQQARAMTFDARPWLNAAPSQSSAELTTRTAGVDTNSWTWIGPGNIGGRIRSILIHPTTPSIMWVGGVDGGVWKTLNGGTNWFPLNDFMANLAVVSLAMDPSNPDVIYAGTGEGTYNIDAVRGAGIFKTTDGGSTWAQLSSTANSSFYYVNRLSICPTNSSIILAATGSGIWRSTDGGSTWSRPFTFGMEDVLFDPTGGNAIASGNSGQVRYSTDAGVTWSAASGLFVSGRVEMAYAMSSPNIVYASADNNSGEIYKSTDGGQSYSLVNTGSSYLNGQGWYDNCVWVDPTNPNFLVVGGVDLYRSTDGGVTLTKISQWYSAPNSAHADHHCIVSSPAYDGSVNKTVFFGNDGGIYKAADVSTVSLTSGWTFLNNNLGITQFYGAAGNATSGTIIGGTQDNGTLRVLGNGGTGTWSSMFGGDGGFCAADQSNTNYFYGEYVYLQIHRSSNGGASSSYITYGLGDAGLPNSNGVREVFLPPDGKNPGVDPDGSGVGVDPDSSANFIAPFILDPNNYNTLLAGGSSLWRTVDAKDSTPVWTNIKNGANRPFISAIAVAKGNSDIIWVGHNDGEVYSTANGTAANPTWTRQDLGSPNLPGRTCTRLTIDPNNYNNVYATFGGYTADNVYRTTDGGATWANIASGLPSAPVNSLVLAPFNSNFIYVGTDVGIFASADGGATWSPGNVGGANVVVDELFWVNNYLFAATHGRGLFKALISPLPVIGLMSATLAAENCPPGNGAIDPGETVSISFTLTNFATVATSNLVVTLQSDSGVLFPSAPQACGVLISGGPAVTKTFSFTANGTCGGSLPVTLLLTDGTNNLGSVSASFPLGTAGVPLVTNFDGLTPPALPSGWTVSWTGVGAAWVSTSAASHTSPNSMFAPDPTNVSDNSLTSPSFMIASTNAQLTFYHYYNAENSYDGGVLEISINGGAFTDIVTAGGTFGPNSGYTQTISPLYSNPLGGRLAWSGDSGGFVPVTVNLPAGAAGQSIRLRWRFGSDDGIGAGGWYVDTISVTDGYACCTGTQPSFQSIMRTNGNVTLAWTMVPGTTNRVQYKTNLLSATWTDLSGDITTNGVMATKVDTGAGSSQRFYRIRTVP